MNHNITNIGSAEAFDALIHQTEKPVVIDFWAPWCGPCQALGPILEQTATQIGEDAVIAKVNIDDLPEIARANGITSIPTLFYYAGGSVQHRESGIPQANAIIARVNSLSATV